LEEERRNDFVFFHRDKTRHDQRHHGWFLFSGHRFDSLATGIDIEVDLDSPRGIEIDES